MPKHLLLLAITILVSLDCFSQITFENGYFINEDNQKVDCLIKNVDWRSNPTKFDYKLSQSDDVKKADIQSVKEFGIDGDFKFIRASVNIDRSSDDIRYMSNDRSPDFKEEQLFLRVLVEGKASLFLYEDKSLTRFFYKTDNTDIQQLVYKPFRVDKNTTSENNYFRQQLFLDLKCQDITKSEVENLTYSKKELERFFVKYNKCQDPNYVYVEKKQNKSYLNLTFRPGVTISSLVIITPDAYPWEIDFGTKNYSYRLGVEAEYILPFNKNKWAIIVEPTYQNFTAENVSEPGHASGTIVTTKLDYKSIEIPLGVRHYFFLNKDCSIFMNASYIFKGSLFNSTINFTWNNSSRESSFEIKTRPNLALGTGIKYKNRYSLEVRYLTERKLLSNYRMMDAYTKAFSVIFGYTFLN